MQGVLGLVLLAAAAGKTVEKEKPPVRVLMVVSAASELRLADGSPMAVGFWANEVEIPLTRLREAGYAVDVVTPGGAMPVADPVSLPKDAVRAKATRAALDAMLAKPGSLEALDDAALDRYAAVVIPGGYAPMVDLATSEAMGRVVSGAMKRGTIVAAICHGPAALLPAKAAAGGTGWLFAGYRMAPFRNDEERAWLKDRSLAWQLEDALREKGAKIESKGLWQPVVVRDRNLITAQNSPSVDVFTDALLKALSER